LKVLKEVYRVLKNSGIFMFSSHNRDYRHFGKPYWLTELQLDPAFVKNLLSYFFFLPRHLRMKKKEIYDDEYAVVNDSDHRYSLLIYYISIAKQIQQLEKTGFSHIEAYDAQGALVKTDTESFWIHYLARK
jgi:SAM-dependent methyltransferase